MRVIRVENHEALSDLSAGLLAERIAARPDIVLGLPTGGTPLGVYTRLVAEIRAGALDVSQVTVFNLDEYVGLPPDHIQSYHAYMRRHLYDQVAFDESRLHIPDGNAADLVESCRAYEAAIAAARGIDLTILGMGANGHIAFNEPGGSLGSRVRVVRLSERTVLDNARFFADPEAVPRHAVTMGVGTIRDSHALLLIASGKGKAPGIAAALEGPVTSRCPASAIQLHPRVVVVVDEDAASLLEGRHPTRTEFLADPYAAQFLFS